MTPNQLSITLAIMAVIFILVLAYMLLFKSHETRYSKRLTIEGWNYYEYYLQSYTLISKSEYIKGKAKEKETRKKLRNT